MKTAEWIKKIEEWRGLAYLYKLSEPLGYDYDDPTKTTEYVIVSRTHVFGDPETYMFAADKDGEVLAWGEMEASRKGNWSHEEILQEAGYEVKASGGPGTSAYFSMRD